MSIDDRHHGLSPRRCLLITPERHPATAGGMFRAFCQQTRAIRIPIRNRLFLRQFGNELPLPFCNA